MEELSLQEDLSVSDGDHIGGDVGGHITGLGLNDGEGGQGAGTVVLVHLGCTLEETRVEIEDITRVSLATRRTSEKKGHLTVGDGLLGQIVIDDESVLSVVTEVLTNGTAGVGSQELERSGIGCSSSDDDRVLHAVTLLKETHDIANGRALLADGDVDAVERLGVVASLEDSLLVDDGVDGNSGLTSLSVTNDQLTLASANGHLK